MGHPRPHFFELAGGPLRCPECGAHGRPRPGTGLPQPPWTVPADPPAQWPFFWGTFFPGGSGALSPSVEFCARDPG